MEIRQNLYFPPRSPTLRPHFSSGPPSNFHLGSLVDVLTDLCDRSREAPAQTEYQLESGPLTLIAITERSGGVSIVLAGQDEPIEFEHQGLGATILGWCEREEGFHELGDVYGFVADHMRWLPSKPLEVRKL